jgi:protein CpxP
MRMISRHSAVVTAAVVGLAAMSAAAAPPGAKDPTAVPPPASTSEPTNSNATTAESAPGTQQSMEARVEQRINDLHAKLQITQAQESEWQKFAQTMRDNARKMDQAFESRMNQMDSMTAMDNMQSYARLSQQHAQDVQALLPPFRALYGRMSQSQKQTADQVFREDANHGDQGKQPG